MSKFAEAILSAFGMAAKEAKDENELTQLVSTTMTALDAEPTVKEEPPVMEKKEESEPPADGGQDGGATAAMDSKLDKILERLDALERKNVQDEKPLHDESALDSLIEKLSGGEKPDGGAAVTIPAEEAADMDPASRDAAVTLLKKVRPAVAEIKDAAERARVVDALISSIKGPDVMGQVMQAVQANAQKAADTAQVGSFEARCRESEAAYAARNPHKKKED